MNHTLAPAGLSRAELLDTVAAFAAEPARWRRFVRFRGDTRYWRHLHAEDALDVWLLTWLPGQATELHDHGGSGAAISVVRGELTEDHADAAGRIERHQLTVGTPHWVAPDTQHDVHLAGGPPAVSVHAYSPPLTRMTYYRREPDGTLRPDRSVRTGIPEA